jgi:hypothetical protein
MIEDLCQYLDEHAAGESDDVTLAWEVVVNDMVIRVSAATIGIFDTPGAAFAAAEHLRDRLLGLGYRLGHLAEIGVICYQPGSGWRGRLSIGVVPRRDEPVGGHLRGV